MSELDYESKKLRVLGARQEEGVHVFVSSPGFRLCSATQVLSLGEVLGQALWGW